MIRHYTRLLARAITRYEKVADYIQNEWNILFNDMMNHSEAWDTFDIISKKAIWDLIENHIITVEEVFGDEY